MYHWSISSMPNSMSKFRNSGMGSDWLQLHTYMYILLSLTFGGVLQRVYLEWSVRKLCRMVTLSSHSVNGVGSRNHPIPIQAELKYMYLYINFKSLPIDCWRSLKCTCTFLYRGFSPHCMARREVTHVLHAQHVCRAESTCRNQPPTQFIH